MTTSPLSQDGGPLSRLARLRESLAARSRIERELMVFGLMTLFGLIVMPFLIFIASGRVLGPYTHGTSQHAGALSLVADYYTGLVHGSAVFWCVALGPAVLVLLIRVFLTGWRSLPTARRS
ncbi:MAG TPA: hypothetical protein VIE42_14485 [Steroidobacteraceae bacterium]|jgi:hypothetical protein